MDEQSGDFEDELDEFEASKKIMNEKIQKLSIF
jgi:hypothetical protein